MLARSLRILSFGLVVMVVATGLASASSKFALVAGGAMKAAGDPKDYFSADFFEALNVLARANFKVTLLYSDGTNHSSVQQAGFDQISRAYGRSPDAFTEATFLRELERLAKSVRKGDQALLVVGSHGYPRVQGRACSDGWPKPAETTSICALLGAPKNEMFDLERLKPYRDRIENAGATLGIMVLTCHSGFAASLGTDRTCFISATGEDKEDGFFSKSFWANAKERMSLEEAFHQGRKMQEHDEKPLISSELGRSVAPCRQIEF